MSKQMNYERPARIPRRAGFHIKNGLIMTPVFTPFMFLIYLTIRFRSLPDALVWIRLKFKSVFNPRIPADEFQWVQDAAQVYDIGIGFMIAIFLAAALAFVINRSAYKAERRPQITRGGKIAAGQSLQNKLNHLK